jgi:cell division septum initiation protein DivIVA
MEKVILVEDAVLRDTFWNAAIDLKKENDELKQRIKRLEEAGDEMWKWRDVISAQKWEKAKEAKP